MLLTPKSLFFNKNISPTQLKASITVNAGCPGHLIAAFRCVGKKMMLIFLVMLCCGITLAAYENFEDDFNKYQFSEGFSPYLDGKLGLWGYIDKTGKVALPAKYDTVFGFRGGLAFVELLNDEGEYSPYFIDKKGKIVIDPAKNGYTSLSDFSDGLALVELPDKARVFIDTTGEIALRPNNMQVASFSEGLAGFVMNNAKDEAACGYIDTKGKTVIAAQYSSAGAFHDGVAVVGFPPDKDGQILEYYIDKTGKVLFQKSDTAGVFNDGVAPDYDYNEETYDSEYFFVDKNNKEVVRLKGYSFVSLFYDNRALVEKDYDYRGFVDKTGKEVIAANYIAANNFSEGLAAVLIDEKVGFIDVNGKLIIKASLTASTSGRNSYGGVSIGMYNFSDGLSPFKDVETSLWGFIDKTGKKVIPAQYARVGGFSGGLASVVVWDEEEYLAHTYFIDKKGKVVFDPEKNGYYVLSEFSDGFALVELEDGKQAYIDITGKVVFKSEYAENFTFSEGLAGFRQEDEEGLGLIGYMDTKFEPVISRRYTSATPFTDGLALVTLVDQKTEQETRSFIDKKGGFAFETDQEVSNFSDGLVKAGDDYNYGYELTAFTYLDKKGKEVLTLAKYYWTGNFSQNRAVITNSRGKKGFVDKTGKLVIKPAFKNVNGFSEGLAAYLADNLVGFMDLNGKTVITPQFAPDLSEEGKGGDFY